MRTLTMIILLAVGAAAHAGAAARNAVEVGDVHWGRDFDAALERSAQEGKPLFVLFQEVPGCSGVRQFGREVLTNPLLVRAIEDEFIPMLVYNNRSSGMDRALLERYREPAWNYQVIRFLDAEGEDVIPRRDRVWTVGAVAGRMIEASLRKNNRLPRETESRFGLRCQHIAALFFQAPFPPLYLFWFPILVFVEPDKGGFQGVTFDDAAVSYASLFIP